MNALALVDTAARGRVLVVGALPPEGRDLDVLAPAASLEPIREALRRNGFVPRRTTWARFSPLELVDVRPLADESALTRAVPLDGCANVCRPDPRDVPPKAPSSRVARRVRRVRESGVIALSGLDGSGKSTQAELLRDTLRATGFDAVVEWNRLSHDRWLDAVARPVKRLLRRGAPPASSTATGSSPVAAQAAPGALRGVWVVVVAVANALAHVRSVRRHTLAGRLVICDRYVLDSVVHLLTDYPPGPGRRVAVAVVRLLSPRPRAAFLLAVAPEVADERKPRPGRRERIATQAVAYDAEHERLGVVRLDATRPVEDLAAEIARETWRRV